MNFIQSILGKLGARAASEPALAFEHLGFEGEGAVLCGRFRVDAAVAFAPAVRVALRSAQGELQLRSDESSKLLWLPRGTYAFRVSLPEHAPKGAVSVHASLLHYTAMATFEADRREAALNRGSQHAAAMPPWQFESVAPTPDIGSLAWTRGHVDWFYRHFDHAATTVIGYLLGDSPLLRGRILDIGCGDGITDLGIALRTQCRQLVGVDPFRGYERLPQIVADNKLPADIVPSNLRFMAEDANLLPFADDSFDVVISWGSVEHMAGGYLQALREVKRVLVPDGLFLVIPGLFYSTIGHHLGEFSDEPFFHLKKTPEELRRLVMETPPRYIDRSGEFAGNEQYWKWYTELNRITVAQFEKELRALEFEPWRVAIRTNELVEYTPELQPYSFEQLANNELYVSCYNRKKKRG